MLKATVQELNALRELEPDWNGEDAPAIDTRAIDKAVSIVRHFESCRFTLEPDVAPTPDGGVGLSWDLAQSFHWLILSTDGEDITYVSRINDHINQTHGGAVLLVRLFLDDMGKLVQPHVDTPPC